jgi:multicomponent Na+:H+ antiporter subunit D
MNNPLWTALGIVSNPLWASLAVMIPLLAAVLIFILGRRSVWFLLSATVIGVLISVSKLAGLVWTKGPQEYFVGGWTPPLGIQWYVDGLSVLMLFMTAIVASFLTGYALKYLNCFKPKSSQSFQREEMKEAVKFLPPPEYPSTFPQQEAIPEAKLQHPLVPVEEKKCIVPVSDDKLDDKPENGSKISFSQPENVLFWSLWLLLWGGLNALFLSSDLFNLYIALEIVILAAVPLISWHGDMSALTAGMRYFLVSITASLIYLLGLALLYGAFGALDLTSLALDIQAGPTTYIAISLMLFGLLIKTALFPLHVWLPVVYANAPAPVSALLAALVMKAPFYMVLRLWFEIFPSEFLPTASQLFGILGAMALIWGGWQAWQQQQLKLLIAYSVVAQVGYFFLLFPIASSMIDTWSIMAWQGGILFMLSHALAIAAMFLVAGNILHGLGTDKLENLRGFGRKLPMTFVAFVLAGVNIIGLPPCGSFVAHQFLFRAAWYSGQWWWIGVIMIGNILALAYFWKVLRYAVKKTDNLVQSTLPLSMQLIPLILAIMGFALGFITTYPFNLLEIGSPFE